MFPLSHTLTRVDAADIAHDRGAGEEAIITAIEGEDPDVHRLTESQEHLAGALLELIRKLVVPKEASQTAKRFVALCLHLCPDVVQLSQSAAAKQLNVTRASLSKHSIALAGEFGLGHARWRKCEGARSKYRDAQLRAVAAGTHASFKRRARLKQNRKGKKRQLTRSARV
jgi:hypothetical protein